jgi:YjbE family integral membrane protein
MDFTSGAFWAALGSIALFDIVLSGDNAVVIALAARSLPAQQQRKAVVWGSAAAILMRIGLTLIAGEMLRLPYLKAIGAVLLLYIGIKLLSQGGESDANHPEVGSLGAAIRTILIADLVMSLDNVLAIAAAANGNTPLLIIGLMISIPLIIFGSTLLLKIMVRFPIIITFGAGLLGVLAGEMLLTDPIVVARFGLIPHSTIYVASAIGAAFVIAVGTWLKRRKHVPVG